MKPQHEDRGEMSICSCMGYEQYGRQSKEVKNFKMNLIDNNLQDQTYQAPVATQVGHK